MNGETPGSHTVEKIGGTSIAATGTVLRNVFLKPDESALYNRAFVVSAYGGMTNLLLEDKKTGAPGVYGLFATADSEWAWGEALTRVGERMREINGEVLGGHCDQAVADNFVRDRIEGVRSCLLDLLRLCSYGQFHLDEHLAAVREMLAALGEAHSAHNTALLLRQHGVNAVFIDLTGWRDEGEPMLDERIRQALSAVDPARELPIITGYAHCREGMLKSFGRGYTEATFSRVAAVTAAREAIIHKEYHLSSADPKIVGAEKVRKIGRTNYDVADQLSNMGMEAIHPRAAKSLRQAGIPLRVRNTFDAQDEGTVISSDYVSAEPAVEIIAGRRGVFAFEFFEQDMVGVRGYEAAIIERLDRRKVDVIATSSNANTVTHYLHASLKTAKQAVSDLQMQFPAAAISVRKVALLCVVGSDLKARGLTARAAQALAEAGIETLGVHQCMRNVDIQFVVEDAQYEKGVAALHKALIERRTAVPAERAPSRAA